MRTIAIGDIHGGLRGLKQLLEAIAVKPTDQFVFLGDYVDGWSEAAQTIQFLIEFSKKHTCVFIKGNHDVWCEEWLATDQSNPVWLAHGGQETVESYTSFSGLDKKEHLKFFEEMTLFHIDGANRLFIHAGFTSMHGAEKETFKANFYFDRTLWEVARILSLVDIPKRTELDTRLSHYHEIYIGHTPTTNFGESRPMQAANVWNVDTGAAFKGKLSAIDIDSKVVFQSDPVYTLYPNESGRNK